MLKDQLVILQPTPFCNIECRYCYLPQRSNSKRMSSHVLHAIFSQVFQSRQVRDPITFVWHAGEPLTLPCAFYYDAFEMSEAINRQYRRDYVHSIQTNATLIDSEFVELFRRYNVRIGVSLDGPELIHDRQRVTRSGSGTHRQVMQGISLLKKANVGFGIIMVLTYFALDYADAIFDFFVANHFDQVAFNIDEMEGVHTLTSYELKDAITKYQMFMGRFLERMESAPGMLTVREFRSVFEQLLAKESRIPTVINSTNCPMHILNFDYLGNYTTFSPELMGTRSRTYQDFKMGNILSDPIDRITDDPVFQKVNAEVQRGVELCRNTCQYWQVCGGGAPSNKFFEHGRFDVTETIACRIHKQVLTDVILDHLERRLLNRADCIST